MKELRWLIGIASLSLAAPVIGSTRAGETVCAVAPETVRFPADVYLFRGVVEEPLLRGNRDGEWVLRLRVLEPIHLPETLALFDIVPHKLDDDCSPRPWTRREMIDGFVSGDEVKVAAYPTGELSPIGSPQLASIAMQGIVLLAGRSAGGVTEIRDSYDYLWALHRIEKELEDIEKVGTLTAIGRWIDDRAAFASLLDAQLTRKRLRSRLLGLHDRYHLDRGTMP